MSYSVLPGDLDLAVANWLQAQDGGVRRAQSGQLSEKYRLGRNSSDIDLGAYLTTRMPATYAAIGHVIAEISRIAPNFAPTSMLDVGAGPGTASWAALQRWPELANISMIDADVRFVELAKLLAQQANIEVLATATITRVKINETVTQADFVIAAYVFAELADKDAGLAAQKLWQQTQHTLVIIEPGTPRGFARIKVARDSLIKVGAHIVGPCTHANACPMSGSDWCHFTQRLGRSREHMHAKHATVPFEDENLSWIAVSRKATNLPLARIVAPVEHLKHAMTLKLCSADGLSFHQIARRDKAAYKRHRKLTWGNAVPPQLDDQDV